MRDIGKCEQPFFVHITRHLYTCNVMFLHRASEAIFKKEGGDPNGDEMEGEKKYKVENCITF